MNIIKYSLVIVCLLIGIVSCGKFKLVAVKRPHWGFVGVKYRKPKLLGHGLGFGGLGGFGGHVHGGFGGGHSYHNEHHEYHHESHHSEGGFGGGWLGK